MTYSPTLESCTTALASRFQCLADTPRPMMVSHAGASFGVRHFRYGELFGQAEGFNMGYFHNWYNLLGVGGCTDVNPRDRRYLGEMPANVWVHIVMVYRSVCGPASGFGHWPGAAVHVIFGCSFRVCIVPFLDISSPPSHHRLRRTTARSSRTRTVDLMATSTGIHPTGTATEAASSAVTTLTIATTVTGAGCMAGQVLAFDLSSAYSDPSLCNVPHAWYAVTDKRLFRTLWLTMLYTPVSKAVRRRGITHGSGRALGAARTAPEGSRTNVQTVSTTGSGATTLSKAT